MSEVSIPPARTPDQRFSALAQANAIRIKRAQDKRLIKQRELDPRAILENPPVHWERARVAELLLSIRGVGHTKVERMLRRCDISPSRTLRGLTRAQRERLRNAIDRYCVMVETSAPQLEHEPVAARL